MDIGRQEEKEENKASSLKAGAGDRDRETTLYWRLTEVLGAESAWKGADVFLRT